MAFKQNDLPLRRYEYGVHPPTLGAEVINNTMFLGHRYANERRQLLWQRIDRERAVYAKLARDLVDAYTARHHYDLFSKGERKALEKWIKQLERKAREHQRWLKHKEAIKQETIAAEKALRAEWSSRLFWGTRQLADQAVKLLAPKGQHFRKWDGSGVIGVQCQKGKPVESQFRLEVVRELSRGRKLATAWLRIGSLDKHGRPAKRGKIPVWVQFPVLLHRELPADGVIRRVAVHRRRVGGSLRWSMQVTVAKPDWTPADNATTGHAAIDQGWRFLPGGGIRIGMLSDDSGGCEELIIHPCSHTKKNDPTRLDKADELRSMLDRKFDTLRNELKDWLKVNEVPDWLREATRYIHLWKRRSRLRDLLKRWEQSRFPGDELIFGLLIDWRYDDNHLSNWEANQRRKAVAWRNNFYRNLAAKYARRYRSITFDDADYRRMAKKEKDKENPAAGRRHWVAPGVFRQIFESRFTRSFRVKAAGTTSECHHCGSHLEFGAAEEILCGGCMRFVNRDVNASLNLLARGLEAEKSS